jgi:hypothetical protein
MIFSYSCATPTVNGGINLRYEQVGEILKHCDDLEGKKVAVRAVYEGWHCIEGCIHPGLTRSDTCVMDSSGCIYLKGTGGLDPIMDRGKEVFFRAVVRKTSKGICYLEVQSIDEIR